MVVSNQLMSMLPPAYAYIVLVKIVIIFEKCRIELENGETMNDYGNSYFKGIFGEDQFREYMGELEKIWNKDKICIERL